MEAKKNIIKLSEIKTNNQNTRLLKKMAEDFKWAVVMTENDLEWKWAPVAATIQLEYALAVLRDAPKDYAIVELD